MKVRITAKPTVDCIDGIQLNHFQPGCEYEIGAQLADLMIVEGWADPIVPDSNVIDHEAPKADSKSERRSNILRLNHAG